MRIRSLLVAVALLSSMATTNAKAMVIYEITGEMFGQFIPVSSDAAADLFGVPRGSALGTVDAILQVVVDPASIPFIETNTSIGQEVTYFDAILAARVDINGVVFETTRMPTAGTQQNEIEVNNTVAPSGLDAVNIFSQNGLSDLWTTETVPFNQTVGGVFLEDAIVTIANFQALFTGIGTGWLDGFGLPETTADFADITGLVANLQFGIDLGPGLSQGFLQLTMTQGEVTASPATVPEPVFAGFLFSGLGVLALVRRRGVRA